MKKHGSELIFISMILRDGSGVDKEISNLFLDKLVFDVRRLSLSEDTYLATNFNTYVVKIK